MKCVIYLRVSTKEQAEGGYSIPAQREACHKLIREKKWTFVDEYVDMGESARSQDRPMLQEMLSRLKKKDVDAVIVHKIDRLARNLEDHVAIKAILKRAGASLVSVVENIEDSASGRLIEGIHALMAEFYSANLSSEVKKGMLQKAKEGGCAHKAPYGYKNVKEVVHGRTISRAVIDEEVSPLIKEAFKLYSMGDYSLMELSGVMAKKGLRPQNSRKKEMGRSSLATMLQNKFYMGVVTYMGVEYPGLHMPIVTPKLFERVQQTLKTRDQAGERKRKYPHYLKGTIFCGECGSRLSFLLAKGKYPYFYCLGQKRHNGCTQKYLDVSEVEQAVENLYKDIEISDELAEMLKDGFEKEVSEITASSSRQRKLLVRKIARLENKRRKLLEAFFGGAIAIDLLKEQQEGLVSEITIAQEKLKGSDVEVGETKDLLEMALSLASNCYEGYRLGGPKERRLFNQAFFEKIYIKDDGVDRTTHDKLFGTLFLGPGSHKGNLVDLIGFEPTARLIMEIEMWL